MKQHIENQLNNAIEQLQEAGKLPKVPVLVQVEATKDKKFGDFASNVAMLLAKPSGKKPREIAELLLQALPSSSYITKVEIAGPGFINFYLSPFALTAVVEEVLSKRETYGECTIGRGKRILLEFLSSNPTGPLHVGHGRIAAYGLVVCNLLQAIGFKPYKEYYVNDAGRQMDILAASVWTRYLNLCAADIPFPENGYVGEYVIDIASLVIEKHQKLFYADANAVMQGLPKDKAQGGDKEIYIDAFIARAKSILKDKYAILFDIACKYILQDIKQDLAEYGVRYDNWFSEREFTSTGVVDALLEKLKSSGNAYEREGALWFRSTSFGDEKDRVLVRSNGERTYFANDAAYHLNKFERGYDIAIDIFGSDHHGYIPRMKAAMQASGIDPERLINRLLQFVTLYRDGVQIRMTTRGGTYVTLRELRDEVGNDAARFFYVMRRPEQHMDFDLSLAKSQTNENPLYYIEYAYARIGSVFRQLEERNWKYDEAEGLKNLSNLTESHELQLLNTLSRYTEVVTSAALNYEPHQLTNYLRDLATDFHAYYNAYQFLVEDKALRDARLALVSAVRQVLLNGLNLLGIVPPERM